MEFCVCEEMEIIIGSKGPTIEKELAQNSRFFLLSRCSSLIP
jgi:hypothetical protein